MKKQYLVIGTGRFGKGIIRELAKNKENSIVVCDENESSLKEIQPYVDFALVGNTKEDETLNELNIANYDCVFVAIGSDTNSAIITTKKLKDRKAKRIIAKSIAQDTGEILSLVGADRVVYPEEEAGRKTANQEALGNVLDYFQITEGIAAIEIHIPDFLIGKSLKETNFSRKTGLTVSLVLRGNEPLSTYFVDERLSSQDVLLLVGDLEKIQKFKKKYY